MTKNLRQLIHRNRSNFLEQMNMTPDGIEIQNLIGNLDQAVIGYEARWGAMVLPQIIGPELRAKWDRQFDKLCAALENGDLSLLRELVPGTVRAYAAMEAEALALGHKPYDPVFWEIQLPETGEIFRLFKTPNDAAMVKDPAISSYSLQEAVRALAAARMGGGADYAGKPVKAKSDPFDFRKGDSIEF